MPESNRVWRPTRRQFLSAAGLGATAIGAASVIPERAGASGNGNRQTVAIFGGGVAGLTAAHELAERGFDVTVYERRAWGGKARSTILPGSGTNGRKPLPGEHAYRAEFGCYQNLPATMRKIPYGSNAHGVFDNMIGSPQAIVARHPKHDFVFPLGVTPKTATPKQAVDTVLALLIDMEIPPAAAQFFARRMLVFFSSCDARRWDQWDATSWRDFIGGDTFGPDYRAFFERFFEFIQGSKGDLTCARYPAFVFEIFIIQALLGRGTNGPVLRMLNGPTNDVWIDPWIQQLETLGVTLRLDHELTGWHFDNGTIIGATVRTPDGTRQVRADWYVCALPVERARALFTPPMLQTDPQLARMGALPVGQYNGISYYVRNRTHIANGIVICADSPWAGSFIPQAQLWPGDFAATYGDGTVHDKVSAVVANWDLPGVLYNTPAKDLPPDKVALDLWEQIKQHVNKPGRPPQLTDDMLHSWQIDPGMLLVNNRLVSDDPLIQPAIGTGKDRPQPATVIRNLILAGDYLDGPWEVANMEAACFNGRRAANVILDATNTARTEALPPFRPPEWEPFKRLDEERHAHGQPNLFDQNLPLDQLTTLLTQPNLTALHSIGSALGLGG